MSRSNTLLKQIGRLQKIGSRIILIEGDPCSKCGLDEWGNINFCMCPMTEEEKATVAPKGSY